MSGKPPPYEYPPGLYQPPSQPSPSYTYVPAPEVMPMQVPSPMSPYPRNSPPPSYSEAIQLPQTTYVTNYTYQQPLLPTDPGRVLENIDWAQATPDTAARLMQKALAVGKEGWDGNPLWVIRVYRDGDCVIGKYSVKKRAAYIPYRGREVKVYKFEVLVAQRHTVQWIPSKNGQVPVGAIAAGSTQHGEPLYIGRTRHERSIIPGKVHPSHRCCHISQSGSEITRRDYEVLCNIVD